MIKMLDPREGNILLFFIMLKCSERESIKILNKIPFSPTYSMYVHYYIISERIVRRLYFQRIKKV